MSRTVLPSVAHRQQRRRNHRAEHAHQPARQRERRRRRFTSPGHAQRFLAAYGPIINPVRPYRHRLTALAYRQTRDQRFATWRAVVGLPVIKMVRFSSFMATSLHTIDFLALRILIPYTL